MGRMVKALSGSTTRTRSEPGQGPVEKPALLLAGLAFDHKHRLRTLRPYEYHDAAALLADFWAVVEEVLRERGIVS